MLSVRVYWIVLLAVFLGLTGVKMLADRGQQMTCWPGGYQKDAWMAYCNSERYGVYDIEAVWHHVEPDVVPAVAAARVLTLSDSHLQNALSLGGASEWFAAHNYPFYMLGLPTEESGFGERLLDNLHPRPDVLILDASPYFTGELGGLETPMFSDLGSSRKQVLELKDYQVQHQAWCTRLPWACGHNFAYFRSRMDGHWIFPELTGSIWIGRNSVPNDNRQYPTGRRPNEALELYPKYLAAAKRLVSKLDIPSHCIVLTHVPSEESLPGLAQYIGDALGLTVIEPQLPDLYTFDLAHLTPQSSVRWTRDFLENMEPLLRQCVARDATASTEHPGVTDALH
jgi:hypothetical protein